MTSFQYFSSYPLRYLLDPGVLVQAPRPSDIFLMSSRQMLLRTAKGLVQHLFASHRDEEERDEQERADVSSLAGEGTSSAQLEVGTSGAHGDQAASPCERGDGAPTSERESNLVVNLQQPISMTTKPALEEMRETDLMKILTKEFSLLEATKSKPRHLQQLFDALGTIQATSVEAERAFSVCRQFVIKIRNRLSAESIDALCFLKVHFQKQKKKSSEL